MHVIGEHAVLKLLVGMIAMIVAAKLDRGQCAKLGANHRIWLEQKCSHTGKCKGNTSYNTLSILGRP